MRVMVTGSCGFVGSHLTEALITAGHDVTAFCQYSPRGDRGWCPKDVRTVFGDVRDDRLVEKAIDVDVDVVFHLAALIGIPYSYDSPRSYIDTNVSGTLNVLNVVKRSGVEKLIITSTSEVYGSAQTVPMTEDHPLSAQSPYAASKIAADQLALSFHRSFGTPVSILRPFNTYGPRQSARAIIPSVICQLLDGATELRLGNLESFRDLTFVDDTVAGFIAMMDNFTAGDVVHIGSEYAMKMSALVDVLCGIFPQNVTVVTDEARVRPEASEVDRLICNAAKAAEKLNWRPKVSLVEGLSRTVEWFRENRHLYPAGYQT